MTRHVGIRGTIAGAVALALVLAAIPAVAQPTGQVRGRIVDEAGKPVPEAEILMELSGTVPLTVAFKTNIQGAFERRGLRAGTWRLQATKGKLVGVNNAVEIIANNTTELEPITVKVPVAPTGAAAPPPGTSADEVAARNKLVEATKAEFEAGVTLLNSDPDGAIAKFLAVIDKLPTCGLCYTRIGDAHTRKQDDAAAEAAYLKAIEVDPQEPEAYSALAGLYNRQKKFAEAATMSAKANELKAAATGGGGNAADVLNQGIIFWNAGQYPEAKAQFERAISLDPKLADAYYRLGMANVNLGQLPDAVKAFEEYLKLAPQGEHAEMTRSILKSIKG